MADNIMFNVRPDFDMDSFAMKLSEAYRAKGYMVNVANMNVCYIIAFEKGTGGINTILGLGESIKANITRMNDTVSISFVDAEWTSQILGLVVGWFLCLIPFITAIIGVTRQLSLPKSIGNDATMIAASIPQQPSYQQPPQQF